ncbi:MAG: hypothetical protein IJ168_04190 [Eubacterium sp.]|nr:hypothetical protein [Eubacterium sp.]
MKKTKRLSYCLSLIAVIYTVWYMHFDKPWTNDGALSTIGLTHRWLFTLWGLLTLSALSLGVIAAFRTYHQTRLYIPLLAVSAAGMVLTLSCRFAYRYHTEYILHCIGSLTFSVTMSVTVFLVFLLGWKKHFIFRLFAVLTAVITLTDTVFLITVQETGLIETVPIFAGYLMLGAVNRRSDKLEATPQATAA